MNKTVAFLVAICLGFNAEASIRLPRITSDHMVIQRGINIPLSGWAEPGESVYAHLGDYNAKTVADSNGKWKLFFEHLDAGGPYDLVISGKENSVILKEVMIGEVWVCSGQSNMEMPVGNVAKWYSGVLNYKKEIENSNYPDIRLFKVSRIVANYTEDDCDGKWSQCNPESVNDFSAVAYFFGRKLYQELEVPIGLIDASDGGTNISAWMSEEALLSDIDFKPVLDNFRQKMNVYPELLKVYQEQMAIHQKEVEEAKAAGKPIPWREPMPPAGPGDRNTPSGLYNGMISPLMQCRIAGVIWYQGEDNTSNPKLYKKLFPALINSWRKEWGQGNFPFYWVQLAGFNTDQTWWGGNGENWVRLRDAQLKTLFLPNTGMAVASDIGDANDTHMKNKQEVGRRLAMIALAKNYGKKIVCSGPMFRSMEKEGKRIILQFDFTGGGLISKKGSNLEGFTMAGIDKKFQKAKAFISGDSVIVSSDDIPDPVAVRYSWKDYPDGNLYNIENLPASPFRTDDWSESIP